jgi:predicted nucleic acid-binding protein
MGVKYLWDTNTVIYYLQQHFTPLAEEFVDNLLKDGLSFISAITEIELLCWKTTTEKDIKVLNEFIDDVRIIELEKSVKLKTAEIRKSHRIKLPDAIIAATALVYDFTLVTRNIRDFKNIEKIKLVNPWNY